MTTKTHYGLGGDPDGWVTRENNLRISKPPPKPVGYRYDSGPTPAAAVRDLLALIEEVPEAWGIFERLAA